MSDLQGIDLPALQAWFAAHVTGGEDPPDVSLLFGGRSNLTYLVRCGTEQYVLRRPPLGELTPSAHDMGREYRVMAGLRGTAVPVPPTVALCEDASVLGVPFSVVGLVEGRVLRTREDLDPLTDDQVLASARAVLSVLAALHAVEPAAVGLDGLGRPQGYLGRQVRRWGDQFTRVAARELPDLDRLRARLERALPAESGAAIVHGDARIDNLILDAHDAGVVRALVDWEMATIGDPLADLALTLVYRDPAFEPVLGRSGASVSDRMPSMADQLQMYADVSGRDPGDLRFHLGLAYFKSAVIAEGIHQRYTLGMTVGAGFDTVGAAVPLLVAAGLRSLDHGILAA